MKAVLEFELPEDNQNYIVAVHAMDFALTCWDMDQKLREWLKYGHKFESADDAIEKMREELGEILYGYNVNLDMIE